MIVSKARGNFTKQEMGCNCCGSIRVSEEFLDLLEVLRSRTFPLLLISCSRCQSHNLAKGGHKTSLHLLDNHKYLCPTIAADVSTSSWDDVEKLIFYHAAKELGLSLGLKENAFHVDARALIGLPKTVFDYGYVPEWAGDVAFGRF